MAATSRSNIRATTGTAIPTTQPNILDYLTTTSDRTSQLKKLISTVPGGDVAYITDSNSDSLYNTLQNHRLRVAGDKGEVISTARTLNAIIFAAKNSITSANASAYSPDFGVKFNGTSVIKIYDLYGRDIEILTPTASFELTEDSGLTVIKNLNQATMISKTAITGNAGMILGACAHDVDPSSTSTLTVRGMFMMDNPNGTGTGLGYLETNYGGLARQYYKTVGDVMTNLSYDQGTNYKKYSGLVGYLSNTGTSQGVPRVEIYENGSVKSGVSASQKDLSALLIYPTVSMTSLNSFFNESWIIRSTSQPLAIALSSYLNRGVSV